MLGGAPLPWALAAGLGTGALLLGACATLVVIYAALGAANVWANITTIRIGQRMVRDFRSDLYAHFSGSRWPSTAGPRWATCSTG